MPRTLKLRGVAPDSWLASGRPMGAARPGIPPKKTALRIGTLDLTALEGLGTAHARGRPKPNLETVSAVEEIEKPENENRSGFCLIPKCQRKPNARGLCTTCYAHANYAVRHGHATWEELERLHLAAPSGFSTRSLFVQALREARGTATGPVEKKKK